MSHANHPALHAIGQYLSETLQAELRMTGHIASEALYNSIKSAVSQTLDGVEVSAEGLFYGKFVNSGRKAGLRGVPLDALEEWVRQKKFDLKGRSARTVAFFVQRSIKERGIKPAPFIDKAIQTFETSGVLNQKINEFLTQAADHELKEMINILQK